MQKKLLTLKEAGDYLGILEDELSEIINKGKIPSYKIGGLYTRFKIEDLDLYKDTVSNTPLEKTDRKRSSLYKVSDRIKDFFYFYDFYIYSCIAIITIIYWILR